MHQAVLRTQTEYFQATTLFKEGDSQVIDLKAIGSDEEDDACDDPEAVKQMIYFCYHLDYNAAPLEKDGIVNFTSPESLQKATRTANSTPIRQNVFPVRNNSRTPARRNNFVRNSFVNLAESGSSGVQGKTETDGMYAEPNR